ncbi:hypothetical protein [Paenibacillus sp. J2TS4]|uniref:hypothetical protein n=1 Tax=Paenibacillus sp. J2TS4 TaxID=2807194 RepID=UPI001B27E3CF|nr:hypothetical protein [Paenibacillus sp. J2TS4]GIP32767.1 hypothetical protein J2TS4_19770 [Paenibacillus sp. J2TS4]
MTSYRRTTSSMVMFLLMPLIMFGCSNEPQGAEKIAYLSANDNSSYATTFSDLHLGNILDYHLKLTKADQSWVTIWVEGYIDGEKAEPFRLTELLYGLNPNDELVEGSMGFGIIDRFKDVSFFLYSHGVSTTSKAIDIILKREGVGISGWDYAIGKEKVSLESGETKVLGVYREAKDSMRTYDYQDEEAIHQMIKEDMTVLLLKIKVEKDHP